MDNQLRTFEGMRELALFAGAGGGILGGHLLGWRTICAVEWAAYPASVLACRQNEGILPPFPIWDDVQTFDGRPFRGRADIVSGGFPCQDISAAGRGAGIDGERSGMWSHMARIVDEVRPQFVYVENSPMLTSRGLGRVLGDLAALGYDAEWMCLSAGECGAPHRRDRIWILAYAGHLRGRNWPEPIQPKPAKTSGRGEDVGNTCIKGLERPDNNRESPQGIQSLPSERCGDGEVSNSMCQRQPGQRERINASDCTTDREGKAGYAFDVRQPREWPIEPDVGRVVDGMAARMDRLKAIGNGQVSRVAAAAFLELYSRINAK